MLISEVFDLDETVKGFMVGLEVETEGVGLPGKVPGWHVHEDGSLRGGVEYVSNEPKTMKQAKADLVNLRTAFADPEVNVNYSFRTSVHVHVNTSDLTIAEYRRVLYGILLMEPLFMALSGEGRSHNRFCLPVIDAEEQVSMYINLFSAQSRLGFAEAHQAFSEEAAKYSAVNIACTRTFGTIELRCMRGTIDKYVLTPYLNAIREVYDWAKGSESCLDMCSVFDNGVQEGLNRVFGGALMYSMPPDVAERMKLQNSLLITLPYLESASAQ